MSLPLESRGAIVVTGGSRGIGAATCRLAAARGYDVVVNFTADEAAALAIVDEVDRAGRKAIAVQADVAVEGDVYRLFEEVDRAFGGRLVGLVNNAGITGPVVRVEELELADLHRVFAVNVFGAFLCAKQATKRMSTRRGGRGGAIVNLSSSAARLGGAGEWVSYAASKGAIETFTVGLGRELASEGIRVNAVAAGLVETGIHASAGDPDRPIRMAPQIPLGRAAKPEEIAETVLWLLSDGASYVTASILGASGGR